jgi:hypothetical protein
MIIANFCFDFIVKVLTLIFSIFHFFPMLITLRSPSDWHTHLRGYN